MAPVFEGSGRVVPVCPLDLLPADGAEPGVRDELVGAGQDGDRVELDRAQAAQDRGRTAAAGLGAQKPLGAQDDAAGLVGGESERHDRLGRKQNVCMTPRLTRHTDKNAMQVCEHQVSAAQMR